MKQQHKKHDNVVKLLTFDDWCSILLQQIRS